MRIQATFVCRCDATNTPTTSTTSTTSTTTTSTTTVVVAVGVFNDGNNFINSIRVNGITVSGLVYPIGPGDTQSGEVAPGPINGTIEVDIDYDSENESISAFTATNPQVCQDITASNTYTFSPMNTTADGNTIFVAGSFLPCSTTTTTTTSTSTTTSSTTTSTTTAAVLIQVNNGNTTTPITNITVDGNNLLGPVYPIGPGVNTSGFYPPTASASIRVFYDTQIFGSTDVTGSDSNTTCQDYDGSPSYLFTGIVLSSAGNAVITSGDFTC